MTVAPEEMLAYALRLPAIEKARLVDRLISSLDKPDESTDDLWRQEVDRRIEGFEAGHIRAVPLEAVLSSYRA